MYCIYRINRICNYQFFGVGDLLMFLFPSTMMRRLNCTHLPHCVARGNNTK